MDVGRCGVEVGRHEVREAANGANPSCRSSRGRLRRWPVRTIRAGWRACSKTTRDRRDGGGSGLKRRALPRFRHQSDFGRRLEKASVKLVSIYIFQVEGRRVYARFRLVDVADAVGCEVDLAILLVGQLVLSATRVSSSPAQQYNTRTHLPLVETYVVLHEQQDLVRKIRWPKGCRKVDVFEEHSSCLDGPWRTGGSRGDAAKLLLSRMLCSRVASCWKVGSNEPHRPGK